MRSLRLNNPGEPGKQFMMQPTASITSVLAYVPRGVVKIKPDGGKITVPFDPGSAASVLFYKAGQPAAVARVKEITRKMGDWVIEYTSVKWVTDKNPDE